MTKTKVDIGTNLARRALAAGLAIVTTVSVYSAADTPARPIDPFDYSYCGGQPLYPVIGINFATYCGPRNQIALGRRGTLMWLFATADGRKVLAQGRRSLTALELKRLSLLAEAAQLAGPPMLHPGAVNYQLGINFPGQASRRIQAVLDDRPNTANALFRAMLAAVPAAPALPMCRESPGYFDPTRPAGQRKPLGVSDVRRFENYDHVAD